MHELKHLCIYGNPVTAEHSTESCVRHCVPSLCTLDATTLTDPSIPHRTEFQKMCIQQTEAHDKLNSAFLQAIKYSNWFILFCMVA